MSRHVPTTASPSSTDVTTGTGRSTRRRRTLMSLALAGGLALGGAGLAEAATGASQPTSTSSTSSSSSTGSAEQSTTPPAPPAGGPKGDGGPGAAGGPAGEGVITAVDGSSLTVTGADGAKTSYTLSPSTTVHQGPGKDTSTSLSVSDLKTGELVHVRTTDDQASRQGGGGDSSSGPSAPTAADVDVHPAHIDGVVTAASDGGLTVRDHDGFTRTVHTDGDTSYGRDGSGSASDITVGTTVHATGSVASDGTTLDASVIDTAAAGGPGGPGGPAGPGGAAGPGGPAGPGAGGPAAPGRGGPAGAAGHGSSASPDAPAAPTAPSSQGDGSSSGS